MTGVIATIPKFQFLASNGAPLSGGSIDVYLAGTTTRASTWQDQSLSIANTNPVTLDTRGECVVFLDSTKTYKIVLKNAAGVSQWTQDNVTGAGVVSFALNVGLINTAVANAQDSAAASLASLNEFKGRYYGALASDPTLDPNGGTPTTGDEYFNTAANLLKRFNGATWQASDINTANLAAPTGSSLVGNGRETVAGTLNAMRRLIDAPAAIGTFLSKIKTDTAGSRVLLTGTSIASFDVSAVQIIGRLLQRHYGTNESAIQNMGSFGGNYLPQAGHKKQVYGGPSFNRMAMQTGEVDITYTGLVNSINVVYGKETDGGAFDVYIDGVFDVTLSSNGAQVYEQIYTKTFSSRGIHTVAVKAPASGTAYLERIEMMQTGAGVYLENSTLGGSGLFNCSTLLANGAGNKAGISIVGNNGIDAHSARSGVTAPDLIICQHFTNDTNNVSTFQTMIARLVASTKTAGIPLLLISEQPALSFVSGSPGTLTTGPQQILDAILSYRDEKHVTVIDWTTLVDYSNIANYEAKYFPTDDKTHPANDGHALPLKVLCNVFEVPHSGRLSAVGSLYENWQVHGSVPAPITASTYANQFTRSGTYRSGVIDSLYHKATMPVIGQSRGLLGGTSPVMFSEDHPNLLTSTSFDAFRSAATSDDSGAYLNITTSDLAIATITPMHGSSLLAEYTVVMLARSSGTGTPAVKLNHGADNSKPRFFVGGTEVLPPVAGSITGLPAPTGAPVLMHFTVRPSNTLGFFNQAWSLSISHLAIYGIWVTNSPLPIVTSRFIDTYRQIGLPLYMTGDTTPDKVTPGQSFLESVNSTTIEKVSLDAVCWKPLQATFGRLYEMRNKGAIFCQRLNPESPSALAYRDKAGGEAYNAATTNQWSVGGAFTTFPTSKVFTLGMRGVPNVLYGLRIWFYNGGSNTTTYLKSDGTWAATTGSLASTPALSFDSQMINGMNVGWTFTMPDASYTAGLGANPNFTVTCAFAGSLYFAPIVLTEGSSTIARWTT